MFENNNITVERLSTSNPVNASIFCNTILSYIYIYSYIIIQRMVYTRICIYLVINIFCCYSILRYI